VRLIAWNLNARRGAAAAQVAALSARAPDVVALQEVTRTTVPTLRAALHAAGLPHAADSLSLAPPEVLPGGPRRYGLLIASRHRLVAEPPGRFPVPWPERVLSVTAHVGPFPVQIHTTHVPPGSSNGWVKVAHLEGLYAGLAREPVVPSILCGDFNTPQAELPDGAVVTWAQRQRRDGRWAVVKTLRGGPGARWDAAERRVLTGLADWDLADVYRQLHGYTAIDASWVLRRRDVAVGRRFDHVFASTSLRPVRCTYLHEFRETGLSDHSPVETEFDDWPTPHARDSATA
jgi:exonuclease III